jgi:formamidopyrimidine-DNA glycosylase
MPELPEVEVTRLRLEPELVGRTVERVLTTRPSYFFLTPPRELVRRLLGRSVVSLARQGKYLLLALDDGSRLLLHLGMTGQLFTREARSPRLLRKAARALLDPDLQPGFEPDEHTHLAVSFREVGSELFFRDVRKFGKVRWLPPGKSDPRLERLGPDALTVDAERLFAKGQRRKAPVKSLLLDQSVVAGVGNIYADEALFLGRVRPSRGANRVGRKQYDAIAEAVRHVLSRSVAAGGSTISDYVLPDGSDGGFQHEHLVYARTGLPCNECGAPIRRVVIATRSSHYCPRCQH